MEQAAQHPAPEAIPDASDSKPEMEQAAQHSAPEAIPDASDSKPEMEQAAQHSAPEAIPEASDSKPEMEQAEQHPAPETVVDHSVDEAGTTQSSGDDQLPEMFAEPITNVSRRLANKVTKARKLAAAGEQEEIVITAPFETFGDEQQAADSVVQATGTTQESSSESAQSGNLPESAGSSTAQQESTKTKAARPGLFRRIAALFSRSGK
jgi:hypothetical protein